VQCGSQHNIQPAHTYPFFAASGGPHNGEALCAVGIPGNGDSNAVRNGVPSFTWTCNSGDGGGAPAQCWRDRVVAASQCPGGSVAWGAGNVCRGDRPARSPGQGSGEIFNTTSNYRGRAAYTCQANGTWSAPTLQQCEPEQNPPTLPPDFNYFVCAAPAGNENGSGRTEGQLRINTDGSWGFTYWQSEQFGKPTSGVWLPAGASPGDYQFRFDAVESANVSGSTSFTSAWSASAEASASTVYNHSNGAGESGLSGQLQIRRIGGRPGCSPATPCNEAAIPVDINAISSGQCFR
jgi:hypothetical protein